MKRIILGLSLVLMLVQNGFAYTDAEYDRAIANTTNKALKQVRICEKITLNHSYTGNVRVCVKAIVTIQHPTLTGT
jgi:hypothetical protein